MPRSLAFAIGLMLCFLSGWSTADAQGRFPPKFGKSATKLIGEGTALAAKAMDALGTKAQKLPRAFRLRHSQKAMNVEQLNPLVYTINGWKLTLHNPVQFDLPFGGKYELSEIDLRKPIALAGGYACSQVESCKDFVKRVCASATPQCGSMNGPNKVEIDD